jgi:outer membrane protein assembly factor BamB
MYLAKHIPGSGSRLERKTAKRCFLFFPGYNKTISGEVVMHGVTIQFDEKAQQDRVKRTCQAGLGGIWLKSLFLALLVAVFMPEVNAGVLLERQIQDNGTWFPSYVTPDGSVNTEAADDFNLNADIDRIIFGGRISSATAIQSVIVRFYAADAGGGPGPLQQEYRLNAGDTGLTLSYDYVDVVLPTIFPATGRHFLSVQIVSDSSWDKGSANFSALNQVNGETVHTRSNNGAWAATANPVDMSYTIYGTATGAPVIESLSATTVTLSGYLEILGSSFGDQGQVTIGGTEAHVASWANDKIIAYVNEATPVGDISVVVSTSYGSSSLPITITERPAQVERIKWEFRYVGIYSQVKPVTAADGTIYATDVSGYLYALTPDGALKWVRSNTGGHGIDVGPDGTVYAGGHNGVWAFAANGDLKWHYGPFFSYRFGDVEVGPDGNIYVGSAGDMGMLSLTPEGTLRWNSPIQPDQAQNDYGRIAFSDNNGTAQVYYNAFDGTYVYDLNGNLLFTTYGRNPIIAANGNVYLGAFVVTQNGTFVCNVNDGTSEPAVTSGNTRYGVTVDLVEHDSNCNETGRFSIPQYAVIRPALDNAESALVLGASDGQGESFLYAVNRNNGNEIWRQYLPPIGGQIRILSSTVKFAADNSTFYINTNISGTLLQGYLTAISFDSSGGGEVNLNPTAESQVVETLQDTPVAITLTATDPNAGDVLTYSLPDGYGPYAGTLSGTAPDLVYTPNPGFVGADQFTFRVSDGNGGQSSNKIYIVVKKPNFAPVAVDDSAEIIKGSEYILDVLANDSDAEGDAMFINNLQRNRDLSISVNGDQTLTIKSKKSFLGTTSFTYDVIDAVGNVSNRATVTIDVVPDPDGGGGTGNGNGKGKGKNR